MGLPARLVGIASTNKGCESRLLVDPGDVSKSFVLEKLENSMPKCGDPMPLVGNLTAEELACIESYIASLGSRDGGASPGTDAGKGASTADAGGNQ